jgi:hypothetical protein
MPRLVNILLPLALAAGLLYGGFVVPLLISPDIVVADESEEERQALEKLQDKRAKAEELLLRWLADNAPSQEVDSTGKGTDDLRSLNGVVDAVSPVGKLVILDVGSYDGLLVGDKIEVHRPEPFKIGTLEVKAVWRHQSMAAIVQSYTPVRPGDEVRNIDQVEHLCLQLLSRLESPSRKAALADLDKQIDALVQQKAAMLEAQQKIGELPRQPLQRQMGITDVTSTESPQR